MGGGHSGRAGGHFGGGAGVRPALSGLSGPGGAAGAALPPPEGRPAVRPRRREPGGPPPGGSVGWGPERPGAWRGRDQIPAGGGAASVGGAGWHRPGPAGAGGGRRPDPGDERQPGRSGLAERREPGRHGDHRQRGRQRRPGGVEPGGRVHHRPGVRLPGQHPALSEQQRGFKGQLRQLAGRTGAAVAESRFGEGPELSHWAVPGTGPAGL